MKLLFDLSLSCRLAAEAADVYPGAAHVRDVGLARADDAAVWAFAKANGYTLVSKDPDFRHRSFVEGAPPRVVWLDVGSCLTSRVERVLWDNLVKVDIFHREPGASFLVVS